MLLLLVGISFFAALTLFGAKWGSYNLLVPAGIREWISKRPFCLGLIDVLFGIVGGHIFIAGGGATIGMLALVFYSGLCMATIYGGMEWTKWKNGRKVKAILAKQPYRAI